MVEKCLFERDPLIEMEPDDSSEADSTILVRERMRGTKLEGAFKKVEGAVVGQSEHTISILPKTGMKVTYSKRDVTWQNKEAEVHQCSSNNNWPKIKNLQNPEKGQTTTKESKWEKLPNECRQRMKQTQWTK